MASNITSLLEKQHQTLSSSHQRLKNAVNLSLEYQQYSFIKYFSYSPIPEKLPSKVQNIETNVFLWLKSIDRYTPNNGHTDEDRIEIARYFSIGNANEILEKCILLHGPKWSIIKAKFSALSLPEPFNALDLIEKIINIEKKPGECLQSIALRLLELGDLLNLDGSYSDMIGPLLSDSFCKFLPKRFHRTLSVEHKKSLLTVLKMALIYQIENPISPSDEKVTINHVKTQNSLSKKHFQKSPFRFSGKKKDQNSQNKCKKNYCYNSDIKLQGYNKNSNQFKFNHKGVHSNHVVGRKRKNYPIKSMNQHFYQSNSSPSFPLVPKNRNECLNRRFNSRHKPIHNYFPNNCRQNLTSTDFHQNSPRNMSNSIGTTLNNVVHILIIVGCLALLNLSAMIHNNYAHNY